MPHGKRLAAALLLAAASLPAAAAELTVFAAASLGTAMDEVAAAWQQETGDTVVVALAGSSELARQIRTGAPADVFISANTAWMNALEADGLVAPGTRVDLLGNRLVLIAHGGEAPPIEIAPGLDIADLLGEGRLAVALVDAVPAGIYAKAALENLGIWDDVAPQVAQADNVRAAMAFVAAGEAPMGIVYATDAAAEDAVTIVGTFPENSHPPIVYPAAAIAGGDTDIATDFLAFLRGGAARVAFERQGFAVLE